MFVRSYGLFWRRDEIDWSPGNGRPFLVLGRRGINMPGRRVADFRHQIGIYILYGEYGPHYVGLTRERGLGQRLKDHTYDDHDPNWDRFSWFGFKSVLKQQDDRGCCRLKEAASVAVGDPQTMIGDLEALLIKAMGLRNKKQMRFSAAEEWQQIKQLEVGRYLERPFGRRRRRDA